MRAPTQTEAIMRVLADGRWHTTSEIHRRAGYSRLNSRISDMRKKGLHIVCEHLPHKGQGARAYRYKWMNPPENLTLAGDFEPSGPPALVNDEVPRDLAHRFRIYCVPRYGEQTLIGAVATPEEVGRFLVEKGAAGQLHGCTVGVLDTHGISNEIVKGTWLWNPHEGRW